MLFNRRRICYSESIEYYPAGPGQASYDDKLIEKIVDLILQKQKELKDDEPSISVDMVEPKFQVLINLKTGEVEVTSQRGGVKEYFNDSQIIDPIKEAMQRLNLVFYNPSHKA